VCAGLRPVQVMRQPVVLVNQGFANSRVLALNPWSRASIARTQHRSAPDCLESSLDNLPLRRWKNGPNVQAIVLLYGRPASFQ